MPLGANRITLLAFQATVAAEAEVIRKKAGIQSFGNAQIDTAQYKTGSSSADFDGSGDYVTAFNTITLDGDFTIECWYRVDNLPGSGLVPFFTFSDGHLFYIGYDGGNTVLDFYKAGSKVTLVPVTINASTWYHAACVRSGSTISIYHNGTLNTTGTYSGTITATLDLAKYSTYYLDGHLDEVRISDTARYTSGFTPSTTPFVNDDNTLLLMHMDGTDGSTYFDDDNGVGRSAVGLSAIGNAQIDTTRSKFGGASALFDGTGDYLRTGSAVDVNSIFWRYEGSWTVELFFNVDTDPNDNSAFLHCQGTGSGNAYTSFIIWRNLDQKIQSNFVARNISGTGGVQSLGGIEPTVLALDTWHHVVIQYDSVNQYFDVYINGTRTRHQAVTITNPIWGDTGQFGIGASYTGALPFNQGGNGWIDEVRISSVARYSGATITVPTAPFVNDSDTLFLTHMDGTDGSNLFLDDNGTQGRGNAVVATAINNAQISTAQSKFGSASAVFDGTNDIIALGRDDDSNYVLVPRTGEFTWELWIRFDNVSTGSIFLATSIYGAYGDANPVGRSWMGLLYGKPTFTINGGPTISDTTNASADTWYHFAASRDSSNDVRFFLNGTLIGTSNSSATIAAGYVALGGTGNGYDLDFDGYIDELRISNTCRYTASFTPQTEPFTNDANTLALFHFNGQTGMTTFLDDCGRSKKGVKALGNTQVDTAQSYFSGSSALFDGTEDYMIIENPIPRGGDFTIEFWMRLSTIDAFRPIWSIRTTAGTNRGVLYENQGGLTWWNAGGNLNYSGSLSANTWYHIACVVDGNIGRLFVNGSMNTATFGINRDIDVFQIGKADYSGSVFGNEFPGHIDEFRVSNIARYTAAFTPPTEPFQNDANTTLLLHMDGTDGSTDFVDDNGVTTAGQP